MRTIQIAYIPSDEQWERLTAIHKKMRKAGMFDGHSEEEMLRFKMDADQSHYHTFPACATLCGVALCQRADNQNASSAIGNSRCIHQTMELHTWHMDAFWSAVCHIV